MNKPAGLSLNGRYPAYRGGNIPKLWFVCCFSVPAIIPSAAKNIRKRGRPPLGRENLSILATQCHIKEKMSTGTFPT